MKCLATLGAFALSFSALTAATSRVAQAGDQTSSPSLASTEAPSAAATPPTPRFGARGILVIGSDFGGSAVEDLAQGSHNTTINLYPAVDYFVADHLSLGTSLQFVYASESDGGGASRQILYGIGPRIGYDVPLSEHVSLWPKLLAFISRSNDTFVNDAQASRTTWSATSLALEVFVPVLYHPTPHFFVGLGPFAYYTTDVTTDVPSNAEHLMFGGKITLGGWVGP